MELKQEKLKTHEKSEHNKNTTNQHAFFPPF